MDNSPKYPTLLLLPFLVPLVLNLIGALSPTVATWGFNIWAFSPPAILATIIGLYILCCIPAVASAISQTLTRSVISIGNLQPLWRTVAVAMVSAAAGGLFILFRSDSPIYGDGYTVVANSVAPVFAPPESLHDTIKFVPVILYRIGAFLLVKQMHLDARLAFGIVSSIGGVFGFWGLWRLVRLLGKDVGQSIALMTVGLASGCTVLFFGHLELYTWAIAVLLWLLAAVVGFASGRTSSLVVGAWLLAAGAMQVLLLPTLLLIALLLLTMRNPKSSPALAFGLTPAALSWGLLLCSLAAGTAFSLFRVELSFVNVWTWSENPYWAFSPVHLTDMLNLVFLVSPLVLTTLLLALADRNRDRDQGLDMGQKFLGVCVLSLFLVSFWLDPVLGALRDWDLLAFFGFPASIFAGVVLLKRFPGDIAQSLITSLSLCLFLLVPAAHIVQRTDGDRELTRIDPMIWEDAHYQTSYYTAHNTIPWAATIQTFTAHPELADKYLRRKIAVEPTSAMAWYNLGEIQLMRQHFDSAVTVLDTAYLLDPGNPVILTRYAEALQSSGRQEKLNELLPLLAALESDNPEALAIAGIVLAETGRVTDALPLFRQAFLLRPWEYPNCANLAMAFYQLEQYDSTVVYFQMAIPIMPLSEWPAAYRAIIQSEIRVGRFDDARETLSEFEKQCPGEPDLEKIRSLLDREK
jgi:tetratricopeptide (TPR) repeat protein